MCEKIFIPINIIIAIRKMQETTDGSGGLFLDICWIVPVFLDRFLDTIQIRKTKGEGTMKDWGIHLFAWRMTREERMLDGELRPLRRELARAGLNEKRLRAMDPDDRVAALERASLNPYDFLFLAFA